MFNGMIAVLMAKLILNDLPHAAGLTARSSKVMYHTTHLRNWDKIKAEGLIPQSLSSEVAEMTSLRSGIYLEEDLESAYSWATLLCAWEFSEDWKGEELTAKFVILKVKIPEGTVLTVDPDVIDVGVEAAPTSFIVPFRILPKDIELLDTTEVEFG